MQLQFLEPQLFSWSNLNFFYLVSFMTREELALVHTLFFLVNLNYVWAVWDCHYVTYGL